jgi:hypothetical protein
MLGSWNPSARDAEMRGAAAAHEHMRGEEQAARENARDGMKSKIMGSKEAIKLRADTIKEEMRKGKSAQEAAETANREVREFAENKIKESDFEKNWKWDGAEKQKAWGNARKRQEEVQKEMTKRSGGWMRLLVQGSPFKATKEKMRGFVDDSLKFREMSESATSLAGQYYGDHEKGAQDFYQRVEEWRRKNPNTNAWVLNGKPPVPNRGF